MNAVRVVVLLGVLAACKKEQPPAPEVTPPTMEEATEFGKLFAKHMLPCDRAALAADLDIELMVKRAVAGRRIPSAEAAGLRSGISDSLVGSLCEATTADSGMAGNAPSYALVRVRTVDGQPRPLLRLASDGGLTYHELTLDKPAGGRIRVADMLLYATGETFSAMIGTMLDAITSYDDAHPLIEAKQKLAAGDPRGAREVVKRLPESLRLTKTVLMFDVAAAGATGDDAEYLKSIDAFAAQYPNDPALDLVRIDQAFLRKDYKQVLAHVDSLDKRVGGDPYLDVQRASVYLELADHAQALTFAKRATERAPELQQTWWALLTAQVASKEFEPALATVEVLKTRFSLAIDEAALRADPRFVPLADHMAAPPKPKKK